MKTKIILLFLFAGVVAMAGPRFVVGVGVGFPNYGYAATYPLGFYAAPVAPVAPFVAYPGYGYSWVGGYWYPWGGGYAWRPGYWVRPPFRGARWVAPRYYGGRYYRGYWRRWSERRRFTTV